MKLDIHTGKVVCEEDLLGMGTNGMVLRHGQHALKLPRSSCSEHGNFVNMDVINNEKTVYDRVWPHQGLVDFYESTEEGLLLQLLPSGDLADYIMNNQEATVDEKQKWVETLIDTVAHFHASRVLIYDIAARNVMLTTDKSLKLVDFGQSTVLPIDADMRAANCAA